MEKKTISHSDESEFLFKNFCKGWDERIHSMDDKEMEKIIRDKMIYSVAKIEKLLNQSNEKVIKKATEGLVYQSNEFNKAYVESMIENEKKTWFKELKTCSIYCSDVMATINDIYELKNRRAKEVFELRAENAKLKRELQQYK